MALPQSWQSSTDRPPEWPAWCVSLVVHAMIVVAFVWAVRNQELTGSGEVVSRDVGIVLKKQSEEGPLFEGEQEQLPTEDNAPAETAGQATLESLPSPTEVPASDAALPQTNVAGIGALEEGELAAASGMTSGEASSRQVGGEARVEIFGIEGEGTKFVYVFDRSVSMEGAPLRAAKQQLIASLDSLESVHQFQIIFFNHQPQVWDLTGGQERIAFATDRNKRLAENFVGGISASGGTYRKRALQIAIGLRPDVISFLTDTDDPMAAADVAEAVQRARRNATAIHAIEFGVGPTRASENFLSKLARESGGRYVYIDTRQL